MAKKTITQAYGATLVVGGKDIAPGTPVALPVDEAHKIACMFGVVPAKHSPMNQAVATPPKSGADKSKEAVIEALAKAVEEAQAAFDAAEVALKEKGAGDDALAVFEAAEQALNTAEDALNKALGE